jgi:hypothetical protein
MTSIRERLRGGKESADRESAPATNGNDANGSRQLDLDLKTLRPPQSTADRLRPVGRVALWLVLGIIFARGLSQVINPTEPVVPADDTPTATWPDDAATAFALDFARTYFTFSGDGEPEVLTAEHNAAVELFFTPSLQGDIAEQAILPGEGVQQVYYDGQVIEAETLDTDHAVLTVEALVQPEVPGSDKREAFSGQKRIFLAVPIGRDENGDLGVYAHPAVVAEPQTGEPSTLNTESLDDPGADEISDLADRFLDSYLSGAGIGDLKFFIAPGSEVQPFAGGFRLTDVQSVEQVGGDGDIATARSLLVTVAARDQTTDVEYTWQYLIDVERLDRWYVTRIKGGPGGEAVTAAPTAAETPPAEAAGGDETTGEPAGSE